MKSLDELREIRAKAEKELNNRQTDGKPQIIVGMGTCGIAAGAREVMQTILEEIDKREVEAIVTQTGCVGMCEKEPIVDVKLPGEEKITYGDVTEEGAKEIVAKHVINGNLVGDLVVAKRTE